MWAIRSDFEGGRTGKRDDAYLISIKPKGATDL